MSIFEGKVFLVIFVSSLLFNVLNAEGEIELIIFTRKCSTINNYYFREKKLWRPDLFVQRLLALLINVLVHTRQ
jgi:hypothetical protein